MSSATLTDARRRERPAERQARPAERAVESPPPAGLRPWHFFLLAGVMLAVLTVVAMRGDRPAEIALAALTAAAAALAGYACYRTLRPLAGAAADDRPVPVGGRTRAALERDKMLTLRAMKELEFDRAMGKVAEADFVEMRDRLRTRALRLMTQLDGPSSYRDAIDRDVAARLPKAAPPLPGPREDVRICAACGARNDEDARFCKICGSSVRAMA